MISFSQIPRRAIEYVFSIPSSRYTIRKSKVKDRGKYLFAFGNLEAINIV